jgi:hypothetical protein
VREEVTMEANVSLPAKERTEGRVFTEEEKAAALV